MLQNEKNIDFETPVSVNELFQAIIRKSNEGNYGWKKEACRKYAEVLMNFFGYSGRFLDQIIEAGDREALYSLQESGLVNRELDEGEYRFDIQKTNQGRNCYFKAWKIFSWVLNVGEVRRTIRGKEIEDVIPPEHGEENVYNEDSLQEEWDSALVALKPKKPNGAIA